MRLFPNRLAAATELAGHLAYLRPEQPIVLGLANEGVPVAEVVARSLGAPLDVLLLERLHAPGTDHVVGVVDENGRISMIESTARWHHLSSQQMIAPAREAFRKIQRRRARLRAVMSPLDLAGRVVVVVDQAVDSGARMLGAIASVRDRGAGRVIAAAPVGAGKVTWQLHETANQVVIPHQPAQFNGAEGCFEDYTPVTDELVLAVLEKWASVHPVEQPGVRIVLMKLTKDDGHVLSCEIDLPPGAQRGSGPFPAVIFAHGFESDGRSPRNVPISRRLAKRGVIGVRMDFTGHGRSEGRSEDATDEQLLKDLRLVHQQAARLHEVNAACVGVCGSGTGAMIALHYAAAHGELKALVIRGPVCGAEVDAARRVAAPTLIIHGERDTALAESVEAIDRGLVSSHRLLVIPDSSRLFNDPISRELMIDSTVSWFADHLV